MQQLLCACNAGSARFMASTWEETPTTVIRYAAAYAAVACIERSINHSGSGDSVRLGSMKDLALHFFSFVVLSSRGFSKFVVIVVVR